MRWRSKEAGSWSVLGIANVRKRCIYRWPGNERKRCICRWLEDVKRGGGIKIMDSWVLAFLTLPVPIHGHGLIHQDQALATITICHVLLLVNLMNGVTVIPVVQDMHPVPRCTTRISSASNTSNLTAIKFTVAAGIGICVMPGTGEDMDIATLMGLMVIHPTLPVNEVVANVDMLRWA